MQIVIGFMKSIFSMKAPWPLWVVTLMALNMMGPLFFIHTLEAKAVLVSTLAGGVLMMFLFGRYGFVRLLGLGHFFWIPLVIWLGTRIPETGLSTPFGFWLALVLVANIISLVIDVLDVSLYIRGDRKPMVAN
ncbi:MAG: hypothetical protein HN472_08780 [Nitrospina sp.]|jgi:hypothetical protein|nr:hypothetical protein [Nitrospina sp.]MBT3875594.1 hypothetical protein [Nitrospina sp.]MBT4047593.1 hypothetical protein [Nitrospina sp.]MBT4556203.1 hypothetical protein [Nitrospina sp.]MBT5348995.1 hypothetical protein [Nitrospina sp.]